MKTCGKPRGLARFLIHRTLTIEKVVKTTKKISVMCFYSPDDR